jgi:O-antigen ligase
LTVVTPQSADLDPSFIAHRTYLSRLRPGRIDVTFVLSFMICLLFGIPGGLIVPNLTQAGRPALLVAFLLFAYWIVTRLSPWLTMGGPQPLRWAVLAYVLATLLSYMAGLLRGLPSLEANAQDFALLQLCEFIGIVLIAADGIRNWNRLNQVLAVLVWSAGFMALTGLLQSVLRIDVSQYLVIPGLQMKSDLAGFEERGFGQVRVAGTAAHYIEFSAVMAMAVPFAIHYARFAPTRRRRVIGSVISVMCAAAVPASVSRTGVVALGVAMFVMFTAWRWRMRYNMIIIGVAATAAMMVLRPGLLGTVRSMFTYAGDDTSVQARTERYAIVARFFGQRPLLGRGPHTLLSTLYSGGKLDNSGLVLDNQWLYTLVTCGIIGVAALLALHLTAISLATIAMRRSESAEIRNLCVALIAAQLVAIVVGGTFDSLYYTTFSITLALLTGLCGAVWRFTHPDRVVRTTTVRRFVE